MCVQQADCAGLLVRLHRPLLRPAGEQPASVALPKPKPSHSSMPARQPDMVWLQECSATGAQGQVHACVCLQYPLHPLAAEVSQPHSDMQLQQVPVTHPYGMTVCCVCVQMVHQDSNNVYPEVEGLSVLLGYKTANAGCCKVRDPRAAPPPPSSCMVSRSCRHTVTCPR